MTSKLLSHDEAAPVTVYNKGGQSPLLLVADHAGKLIPRALGDLGVPETERARHIGWDIGIAGVSKHLADALDAVLIQQNYSRLVIDCNRPPHVPSSMPELSEVTPVPGNVGLSKEARAARIDEIFKPYHDTIQAELDRRQANGQAVALIAMHSFTPVYKGEARPWHIGLLYNREVRLSRSLLALLRQEPGLVVGDQEPYLVSDLSDYTVPVHGERRKLHLTAIEIRQDLIADEQGQKEWAERLARLLPQAYRAL